MTVSRPVQKSWSLKTAEACPDPLGSSQHSPLLAGDGNTLSLSPSVSSAFYCERFAVWTEDDCFYYPTIGKHGFCYGSDSTIAVIVILIWVWELSDSQYQNVFGKWPPDHFIIALYQSFILISLNIKCDRTFQPPSSFLSLENRSFSLNFESVDLVLAMNCDSIPFLNRAVPNIRFLCFLCFEFG